MFYGREDLLGPLGDLLKKRTASLVTCRGRRRIGKSTLVEEFARRNRLKFLKLEGFSDVLILSASPYRKRAHARGEGCQIDLLLMSARTWWVVEIKRRREIGTEIIDEVARKVANLKVLPGVSVRTALVYCGSLSPAVPAEGFFDVLTDAHDLLRA